MLSPEYSASVDASTAADKLFTPFACRFARDRVFLCDM
jgi:hypothetical protein